MGILETYKRAKERFSNLDLGHYDEFNEEINLSVKDVDEGKYDIVDITGIEPATIEKVNSRLQNLETLLKRIVLKDFIFRLKDSAGVDVSFMVHCYHKKSSIITANDRKRYRRFADFYLVGDNGSIYNVCQIVLVHNKYPIRYEIRRVAYRHGKRLTVYRAGAIDRYRILSKRKDAVGGGNHFLNKAMESIDGQWGRLAEYALYHYIFALHEMVNCPERFVEHKDNGRRIFIGENQTRTPSKAKVVQPVRTVVTTPPQPDEGRVIQCPYWTVRGHYRTYKSGKKVWIEPYAKGKERNNPDRIVAKTYSIN